MRRLAQPLPGAQEEFTRTKQRRHYLADRTSEIGAPPAWTQGAMELTEQFFVRYPGPHNRRLSGQRGGGGPPPHRDWRTDEWRLFLQSARWPEFAVDHCIEETLTSPSVVGRQHLAARLTNVLVLANDVA
jgi:hypothetical protein